MRWFIRSKVMKATVTEAKVDYIGSIAIDEDIVRKAGLLRGEKVLIASTTSGERLETYVILAEAGSGTIAVNGAAALKIRPGEEIIIMGFELDDEPIKPRVIVLDKENKFVRYVHEHDTNNHPTYLEEQARD